jgi:solute carrier family 25 iron transporter 28/37
MRGPNAAASAGRNAAATGSPPTDQQQSEHGTGEYQLSNPDEDWEEWDPSRGSFVHHMIAGSCAGVAEHVLMFPLDTYKTHLQFAAASKAAAENGLLGVASAARTAAGQTVAEASLLATAHISHHAATAASGAAAAAKGVASPLLAVPPPPRSFWELLKREGFVRLWRGAPGMLVACVPSHAAYFSAFEAAKEAFGANEAGHTPFAAAASGAVATLLHDAVITPMDLVKQRLQLGYYRGIADCIRSVAREEGVAAFYRSYSTTLAMNVPYAATVGATNESLKKLLTPAGAEPGFATYLLSGAGAGAVAAAVTCPLDVVKTRLQTAALLPHLASAAGGAPAALQEVGPVAIASRILATEGPRAFFKGVGARMLAHTPAMAISWGTYETVKSFLMGTPLTAGLATRDRET